jgi:hypothetical protein
MAKQAESKRADSTRADSTLSGSPAYERLRDVLQRFAGRIIAEGMLGGACRRAQVRPAEVRPEDLGRVVSELGRGLRVFLNPDTRTAAERALASFLIDEARSGVQQRNKSAEAGGRSG